MPLNLLKRYNELLDLASLTEQQRLTSLKGVFSEAFINRQPIHFNGKIVIPCPKDGAIGMDTLFRHLTTVITDRATNKREFEMSRSKRLHWVRFHIDCKKKDNMMLFSVKEPEGLRTYLYDIDEKYVIVFEPKLAQNVYFLLTAYYLEGKDAQRDKIVKKYKRKLDEVL
jgi:hypothetical protein